MTKREKVVEFINNNPNKYNATEISNILAIPMPTIRYTLNREPELRALVVNQKLEFKESCYSKLKEFLDSNPNKFNKNQLVGVTGLNKLTLLRTFKRHPELEDLLRKESQHDIVEKFVRDNPHVYSVSQIARSIGVGHQNVFYTMRCRPELKKLVLNGKYTKVIG